MFLYEDGKLLLSDSVSKYIPEFSNPKVLALSPNDSAFKCQFVAAKREITIEDLLTHQSDLLYSFSGNYYHEKEKHILIDMYDEAGISDGFCRPDESIGGSNAFWWGGLLSAIADVSGLEL